MKIVYGTSNPAKIKHMKDMLEGLHIEILGLNDVSASIDSVAEDGSTPLENARIKATAYYKALKMPVFSCDSGLFIEGLEQCEQPGVHVRRVKGKSLNDDEMIQHYRGLALKLGGSGKAQYRNAICLVMDENHIMEHEGDDISSLPFILTSKPHEKKNPGFPLDSLSVEMESGLYYLDIYDRDSTKNKSRTRKGFRDFFSRVMDKERF